MINAFDERDSVSAPVHVEMAKRFGPDGVLAGRTEGGRARYEIEREALEAGADDPIALDFSDVAAITVPFADECIGKLISGHLGGYLDTHPVVAFNTNEDVAETIAAALRQRRLSLLLLSEHGPELLGGDQILGQTLSVAHQLGTFTAGQLAERLEISPQAANNRLNALVRSKALGRTRVIPAGGGKEFAYKDPSAAARELVHGVTRAPHVASARAARAGSEVVARAATSTNVRGASKGPAPAGGSRRTAKAKVGSKARSSSARARTGKRAPRRADT